MNQKHEHNILNDKWEKAIETSQESEREADRTNKEIMHLTVNLSKQHNDAEQEIHKWNMVESNRDKYKLRIQWNVFFIKW